MKKGDYAEAYYPFFLFGYAVLCRRASHCPGVPRTQCAWKVRQVLGENR